MVQVTEVSIISRGEQGSKFSRLSRKFLALVLTKRERFKRGKERVQDTLRKREREG